MILLTTLNLEILRIFLKKETKMILVKLEKTNLLFDF